MARKPEAKGGSRKSGRAPARPASADYKVELDKPDASPLDFINRRMAELNRGGED
jgi:hypothetical protein